MCDSNLSFNTGCNPCLSDKLFWGCPAPLAIAQYDINNPPLLRPFTINNIPFDPSPFRIQTEAIRQPSRGPTLMPWQGQSIPARPVAYIPTASW